MQVIGNDEILSFGECGCHLHVLVLSLQEIRRQSNVEMTLQDELRRTADELRDAHMQIAQTEQTHGLYRRHVEATISV